MIPVAVALCRRCAGGDQITVARMHGPVCVRHRRWHGNGRDTPLSGRHKHLLAQRLLNGTLALRGVPYRSPEVDAAAELTQLRSLEGGCATDPLGDEILQFPWRIALTARLTDDRLANVLMSPGLGGYALAMLFDRVVTAHSVGRRAVEDVFDGLRIQGRELWIGKSAVTMQGGCVLTPAAMRMLPRVKAIRAHLLNHRVELTSR